MFTLKQLQEEHRPWALHNFGERPAGDPALGVAEELGELVHAHLKRLQGIRGFDDPAKYLTVATDAVGDVVIYLVDYCSRSGIDAAVVDAAFSTDAALFMEEHYAIGLAVQIAGQLVSLPEEAHLLGRQVGHVTAILQCLHQYAKPNGINVLEAAEHTWRRIIAKRDWRAEPERAAEIVEPKAGPGALDREQQWKESNRPFTDDEITDLLTATLHGNLPQTTMRRVFATLACIPAWRREAAILREVIGEIATPGAEDLALAHATPREVLDYVGTEAIRSLIETLDLDLVEDEDDDGLAVWRAQSGAYPNRIGDGNTALGALEALEQDIRRNGHATFVQSGREQPAARVLRWLADAIDQGCDETGLEPERLSSRIESLVDDVITGRGPGLAVVLRDLLDGSGTAVDVLASHGLLDG